MGVCVSCNCTFRADRPASKGFGVIQSISTRQNLDQTKLKAFADDELNETKMIVSAFDRVENIVGKGKKLLVQAISPFPTMVLKGFFPRRVKRCHCVGNLLHVTRLQFLMTHSAVGIKMDFNAP